MKLKRCTQVGLSDTINGFSELLAGNYDDLPEMAFYMVRSSLLVFVSAVLVCSINTVWLQVGNAAEVGEKARELQANA